MNLYQQYTVRPLHREKFSANFVNIFLSESNWKINSNVTKQLLHSSEIVTFKKQIMEGIGRRYIWLNTQH